MGKLTGLRSITLVAVLLISIIVLGINANFLSFSSTNKTNSDDDSDDSDDDHKHIRHMLGFAGTGVAIAVLTLLTVGPITFMNFVRKRSMASMVLLEMGWGSILMILWAVVGGQASSTAIFTDGCSDADDDLQSFCYQYNATQAFSWLQFVVLLFWLAVVMVVAAMAHYRGHTRVWMYPFQDATVLCRPSISRDSVVETKPASPNYRDSASPSYPTSVHQGLPGRYRPASGGFPDLHQNIPANGVSQQRDPSHPPQYSVSSPTTLASQQQRLSMLSQV